MHVIHGAASLLRDDDVMFRSDETVPAEGRKTDATQIRPNVFQSSDASVSSRNMLTELDA